MASGTRESSCEDYEKDERVLNDQTGHKKSETRREVYQERELRGNSRALGRDAPPRTRKAFGNTLCAKRNSRMPRPLTNAFREQAKSRQRDDVQRPLRSRYH